jgi:hypothetical protein
MADETSKTDPTRRRGYLRAIAAEVPRIAGAALGKRGFGEAQLVTQWETVVGPELAAEISPERLTFSRGERKQGNLRLRVSSAFAVEAQHLEPVIIERINGFFGYQAVARITLVQGPPLSSPPVVAKPRPLSAEETKTLDRRLADVGDPTLRDALQRLGAAVLGTRRG